MGRAVLAKADRVVRHALCEKAGRGVSGVTHVGVTPTGVLKWSPVVEHTFRGMHKGSDAVRWAPAESFCAINCRRVRLGSVGIAVDVAASPSRTHFLGQRPALCLSLDLLAVAARPTW